MLFKKSILEEVYGVDEALVLEKVQIEDFELPETYDQQSSNGNGFNPVVERDAEALTQDRVAELLELKEKEISQHKAVVLDQINQELETARIEAETILTNANQEAERQGEEIRLEYKKLEKARIEQDSIIAKAREDAFDEAMTRADSYIAELMDILASFQDLKTATLNEAKTEIAALALDVVRQILGAEARFNTLLIADQVTQAVAKVATTGGLMTISLNSADETKSEYLGSMLSKVVDSKVKIHFKADDTVDMGSCIVETQGGRLDASFSSQLELIRVAFERYLGHKIIDLPDIVEEVGEVKMESEPRQLNQALAQAVGEPSDADLEMIGELDLDDFEIDEDMDKLLQDVLNSDADIKEDSSVKTDDDIPLNLIDLQDLFEDDEDEELNSKLDAVLADDEVYPEDEDLEFEEFNEFAEDTDLGDDSNFDDASNDDRFPEY
ncbi:MAG: FliH/SctL family protein [Cyanobacteria bacterium]|nr:FliH/SctL family protein [Cyanobacteriota bacterium]MDA1021187.1 FliH/SctL family protein [Cyanobacteriota bacterium]